MLQISYLPYSFHDINQYVSGSVYFSSDLIFDDIAHFPVGFKSFSLRFVATF